MNRKSSFNPGIRISRLDVGFILLVLLASPFLARFSEQLALSALFVVMHFFLFCNVLRARRVLELSWAAAFIGLWTSSFLWNALAWPLTYALSLAATSIVGTLQVRHPSYHGVLWPVLNPGLPQWWEQHGGRD